MCHNFLVDITALVLKAASCMKAELCREMLFYAILFKTFDHEFTAFFNFFKGITRKG